MKWLLASNKIDKFLMSCFLLESASFSTAMKFVKSVAEGDSKYVKELMFFLDKMDFDGSGRPFGVICPF